MKKLLVLIFSFVLLYNTVRSQNYSPEEKEILLLQDSRAFGENDKLLSYLNSSNPDIVNRAIFALANIQDSAAADELGIILTQNENASLRSMAAFALGQIPCEPSQLFLRTALKSEKDSDVVNYILDAIGKVGDESDLQYVCETTFKDNFSKALSILRFGARRIKSDCGFQALADILNSNPDNKTTMLCLYAFWRAGDEAKIKPHKELLLKYLKDPDGLNRSYAINALGKLKDKELLLQILRNLKNETDWRAKVNSLYMIGSFTYEQLKDSRDEINESLSSLLGSSNKDESNKVSYIMAYLGAVSRLYSNQNLSIKDNQKLYDNLNLLTSEEWPVSGEANKTMANIFKDEMRQELIDRFKKTGDYNLKGDIIRAFSSFNDGKIFREVRDLISADVQAYGQTHAVDKEKYIGAEDLAKLYRAYSELINSSLSKAGEEDKNTIRLICYDFLTSKDLTMVANCLETLKDSTLQKPEWKAETSQIVQFEYPDLNPANDFDLINVYVDFIGEMKIDAMIPALESNLASSQYEITKRSADALKKVTGNDYSDRIKNKIYNKDFDWDYLKRIFDNKYANIKTNKGTIKIELFPDITPFTVYNFVKLSEKGFYNNTIFHRVVPNFVIQGGDPTATGNGGPGYSIRSEFSPLNYTTGAFGMASSGKDTEGCQFFVTHSPQFHLDAHYTLFGIVKEGQDAADKIQIGDRVELITFSAN